MFIDWLGLVWRGVAAYRVPQGQLSLAHSAETRCEDIPVRQENGSHWPSPFMGLLLLLPGSGREVKQLEQECGQKQQRQNVLIRVAMINELIN